MPIIVLGIIGVLGVVVGTGYVVTKSGEVVEQPAIQVLSIAAALFAAHLILRDLRS